MQFNPQETPSLTSMVNERESLYNDNNAIRTVSGKYVDVFNPILEDLVIEDIAHALSMQCRFGGHLPVFYSVAQHSILCAMNAPKEYQFDALMHDSSEAYMLDIPRPIKKALPHYSRIENNLMQHLSSKFSFNWPMSKEVKVIDEQALVFEWNHIKLISPIGLIEVDVWNQTESKMHFLHWYNKLRPKTNE